MVSRIGCSPNSNSTMLIVVPIFSQKTKNMATIDPSVLHVERQEAYSEFAETNSKIAKTMGHHTSLYNTAVDLSTDESKRRVREALQYFRQKYTLVSATSGIGITESMIIKTQINSALRASALKMLYNNIALIKHTEIDPSPLKESCAPRLNSETKVGFVLRDTVVVPGSSPCFCITIDYFTGDPLDSIANLATPLPQTFSDTDEQSRSKEYALTKDISTSSPLLTPADIMHIDGQKQRQFKQDQYAAIIDTSKDIQDYREHIADDFAYIIQENVGSLHVGDAMERFEQRSVDELEALGKDPSTSAKLLKWIAMNLPELKKTFADYTDIVFDSGLMLSIMLQIIHALAVARDQCGYVHYDLHTDNVMLKRIRNPYVAKSAWAFKFPRLCKKINDDGTFVHKEKKEGARFNPFVLQEVQSTFPSDDWIVIPPDKHKGLLVKIIDFGRSRVDRWWKGKQADVSERYTNNPYSMSNQIPRDPRQVNYGYDLRVFAWHLISEDVKFKDTAECNMLKDLLFDCIDVPQLITDMQSTCQDRYYQMDPEIYNDVQSKFTQQYAADLQNDRDILMYANMHDKYGDSYGHVPARYLNAFNNGNWFVRCPYSKDWNVRTVGANVAHYFRGLCKTATDNITIMALDVSMCHAKVQQTILSCNGKYKKNPIRNFPSLASRIFPAEDVLWCNACMVCRDKLVGPGPCCSTICERIYSGSCQVYTPLSILYEPLFYTATGQHMPIVSSTASKNVVCDCSTSIACHCSKCISSYIGASHYGDKRIHSYHTCQLPATVSSEELCHVHASDTVCSVCSKSANESAVCQYCKMYVSCTNCDIEMAAHELICPARWFTGLSHILS